MAKNEIEYRMEKDSLGTVEVPAAHYWGAQTQRSLQNFAIGTERMPGEIIRAFALLKKAAALANCGLGKLDKHRCELIAGACDEILDNRWDGEFPLKVWQTGSGTQSNMNVNEVVSHLCARIDPAVEIHPNDHVNMSQSSNDTFPTAMHVAAVCALEEGVLPALGRLTAVLRRLEAENEDIIKIGRTHLQDAVPLRFSQEISGWRAMTEAGEAYLRAAVPPLRHLARGGTARGPGLNCPPGVCRAERRAALPIDRPCVCHGSQQVPCAHQQGRRCVRSRCAEGPGGGSHEDRQRRPLAGQRTPVRFGGDHDPGKRAGQLYHARQGESHSVRGGNDDRRTGDGE